MPNWSKVKNVIDKSSAADVRTFKLLDKLGSGSENEPSKGLGSILVRFEQVSPSNKMFLFVGDAVLDFLLLGNDKGIASLESFQAGQDAGGFLFALVVEEPSWRFGEERNRNKEGDDEDELEREREAPGDGTTSKG